MSSVPRIPACCKAPEQPGPPGIFPTVIPAPIDGVAVAASLRWAAHQATLCSGPARLRLFLLLRATKATGHLETSPKYASPKRKHVHVLPYGSSSAGGIRMATEDRSSAADNVPYLPGPPAAVIQAFAVM
ncbi:hypothetical protein PCL_08463 [Purpureocillium lilacinum]|uniref:Uncharacterized protein n=1 Tax=Purpureocillium lilacinum TaxID=33203 RepID=A0A2U3DRP0_PURLI|nr:hypothetical protein PCL_08463 [Purpureocillium lilacinum]